MGSSHELLSSCERKVVMEREQYNVGLTAYPVFLQFVIV